ncbi:hypothetical protein [Saccharospirillum sp.]
MVLITDQRQMLPKQLVNGGVVSRLIDSDIDIEFLDYDWTLSDLN